MKNAPLARVRKFNVYLAYNGEASFTQFCPLTKMVSLKELSFGGIDIINEQSVRENVTLMTWIQSLQLRYNKKVTPNISEILISQTGLKKLVLGHASSLICKSVLIRQSGRLTIFSSNCEYRTSNKVNDVKIAILRFNRRYRAIKSIFVLDELSYVGSNLVEEDHARFIHAHYELDKFNTTRHIKLLNVA